MAHCGVILLRLTDQRAANKITVVSQLLNQYGNMLINRFVAATDHAVRTVGHETDSGEVP